MESFKILIVEDELLVAIDIAQRLSYSGYEVVGNCDNGDEAIAIFKKNKPDLVLLDITIKGDKTGIDTAKAISEIQPTPFIYLTAHADSETVKKAKQTFPAAYLIKPFTTNLLLVSIELALHNFAYQKKAIQTADEMSKDEDGVYLKQEHIFIKDGHRFVKLKVADIKCLEAQDNYVRIVTTEKPYLIRSTLASTIEKINQRSFVRVHRSYCINMDHITEFTENEINLGGLTIPIGRNYKDEVMKQFNFR